MKQATRLAVFACLIVAGTQAQAQVKDMPSQVELDPVLENADEKVKDFLVTLTNYRAEASKLDNERLEKDLHDFAQLREMIQKAHSGRGNSGITLGRILGILASLDDATLEAAVWSNLLTAHVCGSQEKSMLYFALAVQTNGGMLREVSGQLFHPALRFANAADEIMLAIADAESKGQPKPR
jgi:hypothetical protein